jgi:IPT/TIG domain
MRIGRWFVGAIAGTLIVLALAPTAAQAAFGPPEITSITPNQCGSAGGCKVIIRGRFPEVIHVELGGHPMKMITSGIPTNWQCKLKSSTELECLVGFHEHGQIRIVMTDAEGTSAGSPTFTFLPELYRNEAAIRTAHIPFLDY